MKKEPRRYSNASRVLKKAGLANGVDFNPTIERADRIIPGAPKDRPKGHKALQLPPEALQEMAKDKAGGMPDNQIALKYSVSMSYVQECMRIQFTANANGREALKGLLLENALAAGMRVRETVGDLQPMQAVIATGVMTQRFVELDKHTQNLPVVIDFNVLASVGASLKNLRSSITVTEEERQGSVIDLES